MNLSGFSSLTDGSVHHIMKGSLAFVTFKLYYVDVSVAICIYNMDLS